MNKIWEDEYFFELNLSFSSKNCQSNINFYTTNEELEKLKQGLQSVSTFKQNEFIWVSGEDKEKVTHYLYIKSFLNDKQGHVGIEVLMENKPSPFPDRMRSHSTVLTEINQLDDLINQLELLMKGEVKTVEGIIPYFY